MNARRKKRLMLVAMLVAGIGTATALALNAFQENLLYFYSPSEVAAGTIPKRQTFRVGGLVSPGSLQREDDGLTVHFTVTDTVQSIPITHKGILPDLFREGQGIVAIGRLNAEQVFVADQVLAKHDENYMPPEVAGMLKNAGAVAPHKTQP